MQSLPVVSLLASSQQLPPAQKFNNAGEDKFSPALKQATKKQEVAAAKKHDDDLAGAAAVASHGESRNAADKSIEGKAAEGKTVEGKAAEGKTVEGKAAEGKAAEGKAVEGKAVEGKTTNIVAKLTELPGEADTASEVGAVDKKSSVVVNELLGKGANTKDSASGGSIADVAKEMVKELPVAQGEQRRLKGTALKTEIIDNSSTGVLPTQLDKSVTQKVAPLAQLDAQAGNIAELKSENGKKGKVVTDPRFASLLNKPQVLTSLHQQQSADIADSSNQLFAAAGGELSTAGAGANADTGSGLLEKIIQLDAQGASSGTDGVGDSSPVFKLNVDGNMAGSPANAADALNHHGVAQTLHQSSANAAESSAVISLRDGTLLPEGRVVEQTIQHLSVHARGDSSSVTIKLHPEELGELQLRMVMEGDKLKVHLQAQTHQVQDVLERNFPRLRDALQDMGVNVEDFQFSTNAGDQNDQHAFAQQQFSQTMSNGTSAHFGNDAVDDIAHQIPVAMVHGDSLSVRV